MFPLRQVSPKIRDSILDKVEPEDSLKFLKVNKELRKRVCLCGPLPRNLEHLQLYQIEGRESNGKMNGNDGNDEGNDISRALATFKTHSKSTYFTFSIWTNLDFTITSKYRLCHRIRLKNVGQGVNVIRRFVRGCAKLSLRLHNDNLSTFITENSCFSHFRFVKNLFLSTRDQYLSALSDSLPQLTNQAQLELVGGENEEPQVDSHAFTFLQHAKTLITNQRLSDLFEQLQEIQVENIFNLGCFSDFWKTVKRCLLEGIPSLAKRPTLLLSHCGGGSHRVYLKEFDEMILQLKSFPNTQTLTARSEKTRWILKVFETIDGKLTDVRSLKKDVRPNHFFRRKIDDTMESVVMTSFECYSIYEPDGRVSDYRKIDIKIFIATIRSQDPDGCPPQQGFDRDPCTPSNHLPPIPVVTQGVGGSEEPPKF